jgi:hypothetical protein
MPVKSRDLVELIGEVQSFTEYSMVTETLSCQKQEKNSYKKKKLFIPFLMTVLSQSLFTFVRRNFMALTFSPTRHKNSFLFVINFVSPGLPDSDHRRKTLL